MEKPYRRYALLSEHDGSKYKGVKSLLIYGVIALDMSKAGSMPSCDFSRAIIMGLAEDSEEVKGNLEKILMVAHGSLMDRLGDKDIDFGDVTLKILLPGMNVHSVHENLVKTFYSGMLEELTR